MPDRDEWIARRAYSHWEDEGHPHGRDAEHWHAALADWQTLQAASERITDNAGRRIAEAQSPAPQEGLVRGKSPARPAKAGRVSKT